MKTIINDCNIKRLFDYCSGKNIKFRDENEENIYLSFMSDSNSYMREAVTALAAGYQWNSEKLGDDALNTETNEPVEIKPKSHYSNYKTPSNGGGSFNDYTHERINKHKEKQLVVVCSLFSDNRLMYVLEFPFSVIYERLKEQVIKKIDIQGNKYCRTASFSWKDYIYSNNIKIHYIDFPSIKQHKCISKEFIKQLENIVSPPNTLLKYIV
jgi:hypothetical protein